MNKVIPGLLALVLAQGAAAESKKLVCWTDEKGVRACGNSVPPQYAKGQRQVLDAQGRVVDTQARQKTPEEIAEAERLARIEAEEQKRREAQAKYDAFLLDTYNSLGQLQRARDDRLITLDGRLQLARKALVDNETALASLRERERKAAESGKPDPKLKKQVQEFEASRLSTQKSIATLERDRGDTCSKFSADMQRFRELRSGGSGGAAFDCPSAEQLVPPAPELPRAAGPESG